MIDPSYWKKHMMGMAYMDHLIALVEGFIKLSFNGALKGNPRLAALGGLFRDS